MKFGTYIHTYIISYYHTIIIKQQHLFVCFQKSQKVLNKSLRNFNYGILEQQERI